MTYHFAERTRFMFSYAYPYVTSTRAKFDPPRLWVLIHPESAKARKSLDEGNPTIQF